MHMFESDSTFHKYYPELSLSRDAACLTEPQHSLFYQPISISRLTSKILHSYGVQTISGEVRTPESSLPTYDPRFRTFKPCLANSNELEQQQTRCSHGVASDGRRNRKSSWNDMPKFLLAGAVSTVVSRTCVAPLERIKLECIVRGSKHTWINIVQWIWISEGLKGFWKGNMLNLFRMVPFKSINFICYDMYMDSLHSITGKKEITNSDRLVGGGISGITATVLCLPLDTIRTRLIAPGGEALKDVAGCFFHMIKNEGFLSLYKGLSPALISMVPANAVFYAVYDILKSSHLFQKRRNDGGSEIGFIRTLLYGAIAGACAETLTYPLEVIRRQLQLQRSTNLSLATAFIKLVERDGIGSLFTGLIPSTLQVLPSTALSYLFYEMMKSIFKIN